MIRINLTPDQRFALESQAHLSVGAADFRRCVGLLELNAGRELALVAKILRVTPRTVYRWVEEFCTEARVDEIRKERDKGGRPLLWNSELKEFIQALFSHSPDQLGYQAAGWTVPIIQDHLSRWVGELPSAATIRRYLHELGYAWKRPRYVLLPDPERSKKMRKIREKVASFDDSTAILFEDETDLLLFPPLRSAWLQKGVAAKVPISGWNDKRIIFGAINIKTGTRLLLSRTKHRAEDFQFFLKLIRWHYRRWKVVLILDEDNSHIARSTSILARAIGIEQIFLPKRSPELNPLDTLWGKAKDIVCANRQHEDMEEQVDQFIEYLQELTPMEALTKSGVLSGNFWLWKN